jgi:hypothetical protein
LALLYDGIDRAAGLLFPASAAIPNTTADASEL